MVITSFTKSIAHKLFRSGPRKRSGTLKRRAHRKNYDSVAAEFLEDRTLLSSIFLTSNGDLEAVDPFPPPTTGPPLSDIKTVFGGGGSVYTNTIDLDGNGLDVGDEVRTISFEAQASALNGFATPLTSPDLSTFVVVTTLRGTIIGFDEESGGAIVSYTSGRVFLTSDPNGTFHPQDPSSVPDASTVFAEYALEPPEDIIATSSGFSTSFPAAAVNIASPDAVNPFLLQAVVLFLEDSTNAQNGSPPDPGVPGSPTVGGDDFLSNVDDVAPAGFVKTDEGFVKVKDQTIEILALAGMGLNDADLAVLNAYSTAGVGVVFASGLADGSDAEFNPFGGASPSEDTLNGDYRAVYSTENQIGHQAEEASVDAKIEIFPNDVNQVGDSHTFTVIVWEDDGRMTDADGEMGFFDRAVGETVTLDFTEMFGAANTQGTQVEGVTNDDGEFSVTFTSLTAGLVIGHASSNVMVGGQSLFRETNGSAPNGSDALRTLVLSDSFNSDDAEKRFVDAKIVIESDGVNEVGENHTFTVTVFADDGTGTDLDGVMGNFDAVAAGEDVAITLSDSNGAAGVPSTPTAGVTDANGQFSVTFTSLTGGMVTGSATSNVDVGGLVLTRTTDGSETVIGSGSFNSDEAVKTFFEPLLDFGDALASYGTASHEVDHEFFLGYSVDEETSNSQTANADGDGNDDDGVVFATPLFVGADAQLVVLASQPGFLDVWVDTNGNGMFEPEERLSPANGFALQTGHNCLHISIPDGAVTGDTVLRVRLSKTGGLDPAGRAGVGEVEDFAVRIADDPAVPPELLNLAAAGFCEIDAQQVFEKVQNAEPGEGDESFIVVTSDTDAPQQAVMDQVIASFLSEMADGETAMILIVDPVDFVTTGPDGRAGSMDGMIINEIGGNASVSRSAPVQILIVRDAAPGAYELEFSGSGAFSGNMTQVTRVGDEAQTQSYTFTGGLVAGSSLVVALDFSQPADAVAAAPIFPTFDRGEQSDSVTGIGLESEEITDVAFNGHDEALLAIVGLDAENSSESKDPCALLKEWVGEVQESLQTVDEALDEFLSLDDLNNEDDEEHALLDLFWSGLSRSLFGIPSQLFHLGEYFGDFPWLEEFDCDEADEDEEKPEERANMPATKHDLSQYEASDQKSTDRESTETDDATPSAHAFKNARTSKQTVDAGRHYRLQQLQTDNNADVRAHSQASANTPAPPRASTNGNSA